MSRPLLGITMGDPAGIGPEVVAKSLTHRSVYHACRPLVLGNVAAMERCIASLGIDNLKVRPSSQPFKTDYRYGRIDVLPTSDVSYNGVRYGVVSATAGRLGVEAVKQAITLALAGDIDAVVTAPLNKESIAAAGYPYPGHTEILAEMTGSRVAMLLIARKLRVVHVSTHVSLRDAIDVATTERIIATIRLAQQAMAGLGNERPRIAVAGLNPHASEGGLFGREEIEEIIPAIEAATAEGLEVHGPIPPDTLFVRASQKEFDVVVALYHDQGHIPVKMLGFDEGVNVTIGLPFVRTSVDHGTAFDIAGQGIARETSMLCAIDVALQFLGADRLPDLNLS